MQAYIKARGDGLGFEPLSRAEFVFGHRSNGGSSAAASVASLLVDGAPMPAWSFELAVLGRDHVVSVARGPPSDVVDALGGFRATLLRPMLAEHEVCAHVAASPGPPFEVLSVEQLLAMLDGGSCDHEGGAA